MLIIWVVQLVEQELSSSQVANLKLLLSHVRYFWESVEIKISLIQKQVYYQFYAVFLLNSGKCSCPKKTRYQQAKLVKVISKRILLSSLVCILKTVVKALSSVYWFWWMSPNQSHGLIGSFTDSLIHLSFDTGSSGINCRTILGFCNWKIWNINPHLSLEWHPYIY